MPDDALLTPRKRPAQARARVTVEVILEAAARILGERGLEGYNTNAVAERAGVSVGSLYQYFPNKDALTAALVARAQAARLAAVEGAVTAARGQTLAEAVWTVLRAAAEGDARDPALARALDHEEARLVGLRPELAEATRRLREVVRDLLADPRYGLAVTETMAEDVVLLARTLLDAAASRGDTAPIGRAAGAILGYLGAKGETG